MSQETLKMLEKARDQLASTASSLETLVMDLVTSRLQMMENWAPTSVLGRDQRVRHELKLLIDGLDQEHVEESP